MTKLFFFLTISFDLLLGIDFFVDSSKQNNSKINTFSSFDEALQNLAYSNENSNSIVFLGNYTIENKICINKNLSIK